MATSEEQADRIVERLLSSGFSNEDISVVFPNRNENTQRRNPRGSFLRDEDFVGDEDFEGFEENEFSNERNVRRRDVRTEKNTKAPEGAAVGATTGGILGGSLGLLAGIGALAIPGVGPFIAAGPIMAALSGSAVGGSLGLLVGALVGSGIPEYEAKKYETGLKAGNILISVHTDNEEEINQANKIMKKEGAKDISTSREKTKSGF